MQLAFFCLWALLGASQVGGQYEGEEVPQFIKTRYGAQGPAASASPYSGVKTRPTFTKTKTKTKTNVKTMGAGPPGDPYYGGPSGSPPLGSYSHVDGMGLPPLGSYPHGGEIMPGPGSYSGGQYLPPVSNAARAFKGGCSLPPQAPMYSGMKCSQYSGCKAECSPSYQFPNGLTQIFITCADGQWSIEGNEWEQLPNCEPICLPNCQNNGICVAPNQCNCPENFSGPQCQFENKPCLNYPPIPMSSRRVCRSTSCTITCMPGHEFPDGSTIATLICKNGYWIPGKEKWASLPDCMATCNPPCQNGGNCLSLDVCQCPQEFRGPQCQYRADSCSLKKLHFNGGYNCSGDADSFSCSVNCPEGIPFEFHPEPYYTCSYSTGVFSPAPIPQCVFPGNVNIIPGGGSFHTFYNLHNNSDFDVNTISINGLPGLEEQKPHGKPLEFPPPIKFGIGPDADGQNIRNIPLTTFGINGDNMVFVENKLPKPGVCFTWGGTHFKTFDGKVFSFTSKCYYTMARDSVDNTFSIITKNSEGCHGGTGYCHRVIKIYYNTREYILQHLDGVPSLTTGKKVLPIPGQVPGIRVKKSAHYIVLSLDTIGCTIKWDGQQLVQVEVKESLWNRTEGLCGKMDSDLSNDMLAKDGHSPKTVSALASSWKVEDFEEECQDVPKEEHACPDSGVKGSKSNKAVAFCKKLLNDERFFLCSKVMDVSVLLDSCSWDYCSCKKSNPAQCACDAMDIYVRNCAHEGVTGLPTWRKLDICPMECPNGKIYRSCSPSGGQETCSSATDSEDEGCVEGCYCPEGTVLHEDRCITRKQCPCTLRGKSFPPGSQVPKECNTCTCADGKWVCTQVSCGARCSAVGDPHYTTFDGKKYDFMGQCSYYLVKTAEFSIEGQNVACAGAISQAMNLPTSVSSGLPSCTKAVTVKIAGQKIKLKQNHDVDINGKAIYKVPYTIGNVTIRSLSSIFLQVELPNGIKVWWDGVTRVYIDVPANFPQKTKGLCGTFNFNQKDDFLTPEDDVEQAVIPFANKWKTSEKCSDVPDKLKSDPCNVNIHNKPTAEKHCKVIKSELFSDCHWIVDPEPIYRDCLYDMCSCEFSVSKCLCPTVAAYAEECSKKGVKIDWRDDVRECGVHCPGGQKYQVCGNSCTRTCNDVSLRPDCVPDCVEGCNCPEGEALDDNGECVPIGQCQCHFEGSQFHPGYKEVRAASKGQELCTCLNALWSCRPATPQEITQFPKSSDLKTLCSHSQNMEFTTCEPVEPITCKNMHAPDFFSASVCHPGCQCKEGYVLDSSTKKCVKPTECPCHHGGRSYRENSKIQEDCNTCECQNGKWTCTDRICSAECSAWGDSHFETFDGKPFDYQGQCEYALAKGVLGQDSFDVSIQNVPCGSLGTSCSKSVTIRVKSGSDEPEVVVLAKEKTFPEYQTLKHVTIRQSGLFIIVEAPDLGIGVRWDRGTRIYVRVDPRWKEKVKGLCGNYNDNSADDFQTPSGGITEISAKIFGDSWKLQSYCPEALEVENTCEERPDRKVWALKQCGVLKSHTFAPCHTEVPIDHYLEKCIFDACACDQGGDCECLCTALAAYAQECNNKGVPIKWRSQKLCPMQCDERCSNYSPCISTCPIETCDNLLVHSKLSKSCKEDACVEGCEPKPCPPDHIYLNSSHLDCVPRNVCKPICLEIEGVPYYEGDLIEEDECHSCYCSREQKVCKGQPCSTTEEFTTPNPTTHQMEQLVACTSGWTAWINQDRAPPSKTKTAGKKSDVEPLPSALILNNMKRGGKCDISQMVDIQCRTVNTHYPYKQTGLDVECSLERGLVCRSSQKGKSCKDFEIRVKCQCEELTTVTTPSPEGQVCDSSRPHQEHPTDCQLFYHCVPGADGKNTLVEKTCGPSMYYNPVTMTCDWPYSVVEIKPECKKTLTTAGEKEILPVTDKNIVEVELPRECPPGKVKEPCAIQCDNLCVFYDHLLKSSGHCKDPGSKCESGCVSAEKKLTCPPGMRWASEDTCVAIQDCRCISKDGHPVKPGTIYRESDCEVCQCVDNFYACDTTACETTTQEYVDKNRKLVKVLPPEDLVKYIVPTSTVTPPEKCDERNFMDLVQGDQPLPDDAFSASSFLSDAFKPKFSRFDSKVTSVSGGSWAPEYSNEDQYLEIDLRRQEPIYGVKVKGSPLYEEYVTSYKVLYSPYGDNFIPVLNKENHPQIFRGPIDATTPVRQIFDTPFEATKVRINPQTWHNGISLRVELIGCGELMTTTPAYEFITIHPQVTTEEPMQCDDAMGVDDGKMADQQISVSSELKPHSKKNIKLSSEEAWQPLSNSPTEFVQFDFLDARNITGLITKGGPKGWVESFDVKYSHDGKHWNPIIDKNTLKEKVFLGNFDSESPRVNKFDLPISTKYIKVIPKKWHDNIQMKIEVTGCFEPYREIEEIVTTTVPPSNCSYCPGVTTEVLEMHACRCTIDKYWDGENCVPRTECPCMVGHIPYAVGTVFEKEDCSECLCKIGGIAHCNPKQCEKCEQGLRSTVTTTCKCTCRPCAEGTTLCPTSNICIDSKLWCNGIQDCPDDEVSCTTTAAPKTTTTKIAEIKEKKCPVTSCPPGYKKKLRKPSEANKYRPSLSPMFANDARKIAKTSYQYSYAGIKTGVKGRPVKQRPLPRPQNQTRAVVEELICPEYKCMSDKPPPKFVVGENECPPANCPLGYMPLFEDDAKELDSKDCPKYTCNPPPPPDVVCNVSGRTFNTFDGTEYKYDICNHVLARDLENGDWDVALKKNCKGPCERNLEIRHNDHLLVLFPDLSVEFDGYKYSLEQTKKIGSQNFQAFTLSRLGNALLFVSNRYGFWVIWDKQGNVKLGVIRKLFGQVDGLCGFFNENREDDKMKPDGTLARSTVDFGDSWAQADEQCETKACPMQVQTRAWKMCNEVKNQILAPCARLVDIEVFISRCLETTCECLEASGGNHTAEEACRCDTLQAFVVDCLTTEPSTDLKDWRMQMDCPVSCEAPLVYHDCYQRKCEPTCASISNPDVCPVLPQVCFPGCYCPSGFVKKEETCIKPSSCRDCECNVLPHLQYITYDDANFTITGDCVYVMSRDKNLDGGDQHKFQVLITNAPCKTNPKKSCVGKITILYQGKKIHILNDFLRYKLRMIVDGERIDHFSELRDWAQVRETSSKHLKILLTDDQVEVSVYYPSLGVSVKAPSHKYASKLEGLCGDCNKEVADDLRTSQGVITEDVDEFSLSWLYDKLPGGQSKENCANKKEEECPPLPPDQDPCIQILDVNKFGQCLSVQDPSLFIEWCKKDICGGHPELACTSIEAYARDCANAGFCINWRNDLCPATPCTDDKIYNPCGTSCPTTCQSIKQEINLCKSLPVEGCFCPEGKVLLNDTCVYENDCEVCDEEGHHPGDLWKKDKCTTCTCEGTALKCETQHCSGADKVCERGYQAIKMPSKEEECCDKYACLPEPTVGPTCETPQKLICGLDQVTKLDTKANGCQQFICECKPVEDCEPIDLSTETPPEEGYIKEVDTSGCCPTIRTICKPSLCSKPQPCEDYHSLKNETVPGKCCPFYSCEPPKDKCIYKAEYTAAEKGGERPRTKFEVQKLLKNSEETWKDGPCRECKCALTSIGNYQPSCTQIECPSIQTSHDFLEYKLETEPVPDQCCPKFKRIGCKHNGATYKLGEKWVKDNDYCTTYECVEDSSGVRKETLTATCDAKCELGFKYVEASPESKQCCGSCKPFACVVDGTIHQVGEEWHSPDFCTNYFCLNVNGSMQVQSVLVNCPELPEDISKDFVVETIPVAGECCKKHEISACKVNGKVYQIGETWPSPDGDKCKNFTCVEKQKGELVKQESIENCKTSCGKGWTYKESKTTCCGECVQSACVVNEELKTKGQNWTSPDGCTSFICEELGGQFVVSSHEESCPSLEDCPEEKIYVKGCCKHCNISSLDQIRTCSPEAMPAPKTIGLIKSLRSDHGECSNKRPLDGFTECAGTCSSSTFFNLQTGSHENRCSCCQATKYKTLEIEMECEDGYVWKKKVAVPSICSCEGCGAQTKNVKNIKSPYIKSG